MEDKLSGCQILGTKWKRWREGCRCSHKKATPAIFWCWNCLLPLLPWIQDPTQVITLYKSYKRKTGKSKIKASADSVSGESLLPGSETAGLSLCPHMVEGDKRAPPPPTFSLSFSLHWGRQRHFFLPASPIGRHFYNGTMHLITFQSGPTSKCQHTGD